METRIARQKKSEPYYVVRFFLDYYSSLLLVVLALGSLFTLSVESLDVLVLSPFVLSPFVLSSDEEELEEPDESEGLDEPEDSLDLEALSLLESFEYQPDPLKIIPAGTNTFLIS